MKNVRIAGLIIGAGVVMSACGQATSSDSGSTKENEETFTYAISGDPTSTNPINTSDRWGLTVTNLIYSPLARVAGDGTTHNELAESIEPTEDGKSVTVKLKQDITWSDGEDFNAEDVVFTYQQKAKKENGNADSLWVADQPIEVAQVDEYTVRFDLPAVSAAAVNNIATETYIIPEHIFKDETDFSVNELTHDPVGTGPYKLTTYKRGEYLSFEANEAYHSGAPGIDKLVLRIIENADTTKVALQKGEIDASFVLPSEIDDLDTEQIATYPYSENRVGYLGFNTNSPAVKDVTVRQAIMFALDKGELNQAAYGSDTYYQNPASILPPNNPYATSDLETYDTDLTKAKSLLQEAGVTNLTINLAFNASDPAQSLQATLIQQQLQKTGMTVELAGGDGTAIFGELSKPGSTKYNLFLGGYIMGNEPDLYSALFASSGSANYFQYQSDKTDHLFQEGAATLDEEARGAIYDQLQQQIATDAVIYPIVDNKKVLAVNKRIENVEAAGLVPIYTFENPGALQLK